jgi:UDP-sugar transporter A1/2/3
VCLVVHKCATDGLTRYTRIQGDYSGSTVAAMSEIVKFPLIASAIVALGGGLKDVLPVFKDALTHRPFANAWIGLCYTFNNLLYFDALSYLSPVAYQVLSQSKTLFTAGLMYVIVGKRLIARQIVAIGMLIAGALLVQFQELARSSAAGAATAAATAAGASAIYYGVALTLFSSFISALPNVAYEKVLKTEGESQWVNNIQVRRLRARRRSLPSFPPPPPPPAPAPAPAPPSPSFTHTSRVPTSHATSLPPVPPHLAHPARSHPR